MMSTIVPHTRDVEIYCYIIIIIKSHILYYLYTGCTIFIFPRDYRQNYLLFENIFQIKFTLSQGELLTMSTVFSLSAHETETVIVFFSIL